MDVRTFSRELVDEFKTMFPEYFKEDNEFVNQMVSTMALISALAIEKHERENHPIHKPQPR